MKRSLSFLIAALGLIWFGRKIKFAMISPASKDEPAYIKLHQNGQLKKRAHQLWNKMKSCSLCPRQCHVNRLKGEQGFCRASSVLKISAFHPHFGEERGLVGRGGSGAIFLTNCNLHCVFCFNWDISWEGKGQETTIEQLAQMMLALQKQGCVNINVVTPTHYSPHILLALDQAAAYGLRLPLVYNTSGWERLGILKTLDGIVDIYLPDFKYSEGAMASQYSSGAENYPEVTEEALLEMHRQVGVAKISKEGLIHRGLMIRHLVMPNDVSGTRGVLVWISKNLPKNTYVNLMAQYKPAYKAFQYPQINRGINAREYGDAVRFAKEAGLTNVDIQGKGLLSESQVS